MTIETFTNTSEGLIKGSTIDGQVFAEPNGTGSVKGWDALVARVTNAETSLTNKVDKVTGKGLSTNDFTDALKTKLDGIEAGAEVNDPLYSTTGSNTNGAMTQAATTNAIAQKLSHGNLTTGIGLEKTVTGSGTNTAIKVEVDDTVVMYTDIAVPSSTAFVNTANIIDGAVTTPKLAADSVTTAKIATGAVTTDEIGNAAVTSDKIDWTTFLYNRALYYKFSIGTGNTEWANKRAFTIPLASLSSLDIKAGDSVLLSFTSRWHDDSYAVRNDVIIPNSITWASLPVVQYTPRDEIITINFTDIVIVNNAGISIELRSNDYTRNNMFGTIIIQKLLSATDIS